MCVLLGILCRRGRADGYEFRHVGARAADDAPVVIDGESYGFGQTAPQQRDAAGLVVGGDALVLIGDEFAEDGVEPGEAGAGEALVDADGVQQRQGGCVDCG